MRGSTFVFATDLADEGVDQVLDTVQDRGGLDGVVLAANYHHARDILPHNPKRKVLFHEGGATFFRFDPRRYAGLALQPRPATLIAEHDPLEELIAAAGQRGMSVRAWTNSTHNTSLATAHPDAAVRNAFGDRLVTSLCPANPDVRSFIVATSADIARPGVETLMVETICHQPFDHGYHHERSHYPYDPTARFLLGLCFCDHCRVAGRAEGVDGDGLARFVRAELELVLDGRPNSFDGTPLEAAAVGAIAGGDMGGYLRARTAVVTSLAEDIHGAVVAEGTGTRVIAMEWSGGLASYSSGQPGGGLSLDRAWQDGFDVAAVSTALDGLSVLGYFRDITRIRADLGAYRALVPADRALSVSFRPMPPDTYDPGELRAKVELAEAVGAEWVEFYHYGLMRLANLDWVGEVQRQRGHAYRA